jgi:anti-sigma factor (TIGR02949 family)
VEEAGMSGDCDCGRCEERLQSYLDRELTEAERVEAEGHLAKCPHCAKAYRFEQELRRYVRKCCEEPMPFQLMERLSALRQAQLGG